MQNVHPPKCLAPATYERANRPAPATCDTWPTTSAATPAPPHTAGRLAAVPSVELTTTIAAPAAAKAPPLSRGQKRESDERFSGIHAHGKDQQDDGRAATASGAGAGDDAAANERADRERGGDVCIEALEARKGDGEAEQPLWRLGRFVVRPADDGPRGLAGLLGVEREDSGQARVAGPHHVT
eukprot:scaffold41244_cov62-Phaeocystis_antarctica.AAC.4